MKKTTGVSTKKNIMANNETQFSIDLNTFFSRSEFSYNSGKCTALLQAVKPPAMDRIIINVNGVRKIFKQTKTAAGPDDCSAFLLKNSADPVGQPIFQSSVDRRTFPLLWKTSHIKPLIKILYPKEPKDFCPIALTFVIMKALERILPHHHISTTQDKLDPYQFIFK